MNKYIRSALLVVLGFALIFSYSTGASAAKQQKDKTSYQTVTEVKDWGTVVTKLIVNIDKNITKGSVNKDTFQVYVKRTDSRLANPLLEEGYNNVTNAYVADKNGTAVKSGKYVVLELENSPTLTISAALNYDFVTGLNNWVNFDYTIKQVKDINSKSTKLTGLTITKNNGSQNGLVGEFSLGKHSAGGTTLSYADFEPAKDKSKNPLIIWLHGGGEGGTDATIPIAANKAVNFASEDIQSIFNGAYVLAPQAPTYWMDGLTGRADGTSKYSEALMSLIENYVNSNRDIDKNRIYIGGASNGGYMTLLMTRDHPDYFAGAFPVCEGLNDKYISDSDINKLAKTPTWFVTAKNDKTLLPELNTLPTYERLISANAKDVQLTLYNDVHDTSGLYKNVDGSAYQYDGHWSWIYVFNNDPVSKINGKNTTIMEWLASRTLH
ncbi:prolyl oligopeptidase family serine peptidase [Niallia taxi]|nr:prolyl oligopeptidase family serine peptidase [Niallia taxi]MDE5053398.1 prolyl oligopeptidase family serine peptidase [Niallia taxi]